MTKAVLKYSMNGKTALNVIDFEAEVVGVDQGARAIVDVWEAKVMQGVSNNLRFDGIEVLGEQPFELISGQQGLIGGASASINCAYVINKDCVRGRRGRFYLPGITEQDIETDGSVRQARLDLFQPMLDDVTADLSLSGVILQVERTDGTFGEVRALTAQNLAGTQRRRMRK